MERIRQRLLDERAGIQKSEAAKKQRELKKVGKQVQVEKLKERERGKKEMNERVKGLKRSESMLRLFPVVLDLISCPQNVEELWMRAKIARPLTSPSKTLSQIVLPNVANQT